MAESDGTDLFGAGKIAKAIPAKAWVLLVKTACVAFTDAIAPITATTSGVGRLISAKFDRLTDAEKILAAEVMSRAAEKANRQSKNSRKRVKASVVIAAVEACATETDEVLRQLWVNLLAKEMVVGEVHPEFPKILSRLSSLDAQVLAEIAARDGDRSIEWRSIAISVAKTFATLMTVVSLAKPSEAGSFTHEHLDNLNLVTLKDGIWTLTQTGKAFIRVVAEEMGNER